VPRLAILPIWVAAGAAMVGDGGLGLVLMIGLILSYAAAITSLGLALATWIPKLGRVITASVMAYVLGSVGWVIVLQVLPHLPAVRSIPWDEQPDWAGLSMASPFFGIYATTEWASRLSFATYTFSAWGSGPPMARGDPSWPLAWTFIYSG